MSRCFPFPPPGYEKKPTTDDLDLLKKEKRKEKKHKKDKKDREKKEGKEKREKDRSEGKHKEKKDKKDKHRDKKKDKDKDKDKGKTSTTTTQDEGYNGDKINHNNEQIQDKKQSLQFRNGESHKDRTTTSSYIDEKQPSTQFQGQNGDLARNRDTENYKFVQELDRRIRDEEKGTGSHQFFVEGRKNSFNNKVEMQNAMARNKINGATPPPPSLQPPQPPLQPPLPPPPQPPLDKKAERKGQESDDRRGDKRKSKDRDKRREKDGEKEKKEEKSKERSERDKHKHSKKSDSIATFNNLSTNHLENSFQGVGSEGILKKRKESESNGVFHENESRPNKMARPISNISPENGRKLDLPQNPSSSFLDSQSQSQSQSQRASQNNFKMASTKSQKVNGMIIPSSPVSVSLPPKKPPTSAFNHIHHKPSPIKSPPPPPPPVITNHVSAQSPPVTTKPPPPPQIPVPNSVPVKQPVSRPKPPPAVVKVAAPPPPPPKKKAESVKPPHPDTKYLNQILTVPKPEEWGGVDEQEWLFRPAAPPPEKKAAAAVAEVQVWSEAKHIDSVDVCALPYVIPY